MTIKRTKTVRTAARAKRRLRPAAPKVARARPSDAGDIASKPMLIGYARVSTVDQNLALQRDALTEALDTTTAQGRLVFHMFGALAEFERSLIRERTQAGL